MSKQNIHLFSSTYENVMFTSDALSASHSKLNKRLPVCHVCAATRVFLCSRHSFKTQAMTLGLCTVNKGGSLGAGPQTHCCCTFSPGSQQQRSQQYTNLQNLVNSFECLGHQHSLMGAVQRTELDAFLQSSYIPYVPLI